MLERSKTHPSRRITDSLRLSVSAAALSLAVSICPSASAAAQEQLPTLDEFLTKAIGLESAQRARLARGEVVAKVLPTGDRRDVSVFAAVNVAASRTFFVARQQDLPRALVSPTRPKVRVFSAPASSVDVQDITLSDDDLKALSVCRPNHCDFKLPASEMERARVDIVLSDSRARSRAESYVRERVLAFVADYRQRGKAALLVYDDRGSVRASNALVAMLRDSSLTIRAMPSLDRALINYPRDSLAGSTHALYWSEDQLPRVRRVFRIIDQTVYSPPEYPNMTIIAGKQLFASHYFEAGLELLAAVDRETSTTDPAGRSQITLVTIRRYRFDNLPSGGPLNLRGRIINGLRDAAAADLERLKRETEGAWRARGAP